MCSQGRGCHSERVVRSALLGEARGLPSGQPFVRPAEGFVIGRAYQGGERTGGGAGEMPLLASLIARCELEQPHAIAIPAWVAFLPPSLSW